MRRLKVGYDYTLNVGQRKIKIEVKGTDRKEPGIPDMRTSEFEDGKLKADFLILVHPAQAEKKNLYIIPRADIKNLKRLSTFRVRGFGKSTFPNYLKDSLRSVL